MTYQHIHFYKGESMSALCMYPVLGAWPMSGPRQVILCAPTGVQVFKTGCMQPACGEQL